MNDVQREIIIKSESPWWKIDLDELWHYRELLYIFSWRDIKVRYKQTILGAIWVLFQPLATAGIFSVFFGKIAKLPSDNLPYPLFVFSGLVIWNFFASGLSSSSQSLVGHEGLVKKAYFPRIILPLSALITTAADLLIVLPVLLAAIFFFGFSPNPAGLLLLPVLFAVLFLTTSGAGLLTSAINVKYRDVRFVLPFFIQIGLFLSPVIYPISALYDFRKWVLIFNPLTGVIEVSRQLISGALINWPQLGLSFFTALIVFLVGFYFFRKTENIFADLV